MINSLVIEFGESLEDFIEPFNATQASYRGAIFVPTEPKIRF
jgi:hypothetical protein